jgi:uncharacterized protein YbjT (DUF2867 family)
MNIFVTGATGVLGKAVVKRLVADGHDVCALSRSEVNRKVLQGFGAERGDPAPGDQNPAHDADGSAFGLARE